MPSSARAERPRLEDHGRAPRRSAPLGVAGVGLVVATGLGYVRPPVDLSFGVADAAYGACQRFVRTQLKARGPVTFAPISRRTVRRYADGRVRSGRTRT